MNSLVSIVIPCFNVSETLEKSLNSVIQQNYANFEVIMVDDGSADATPAIIHTYEKKDGRFRGFRQENKGVSAARNKGVDLSKSEYIAFLDADDIVYGNSISERMKVLLGEENPDILGTFCPAEMIFKDGSRMGQPLLFNYYPLPNDKLYFSYMPESVFNPSCVIIKKSMFFEAGGFDETVNLAEDYLLWHNMMRSGGYFKIVRSCKIGYTQSSDSTVRTKLLKHFQLWQSAAGKVFSGDPKGIRECRNGFGHSLYYQALSNRAFNTAIMAVALKEYRVAKELSNSISRYVLELSDPLTLESQIRFYTLRALCKHSKEWSSVWKGVKYDVSQFLAELDDNVGGSSSLLKLRERLEKQGGAGCFARSRFIFWKSVETVLFKTLNHDMQIFIGQFVYWLNQSKKNRTILFLIVTGYSIFIALAVVAMSMLFN